MFNESHAHKQDGSGQGASGAISETDPVEEFFQTNVDLNRYVSYLAVNILMQNWDSLNKNSVLVHDTTNSGKQWFSV